MAIQVPEHIIFHGQNLTIQSGVGDRSSTGAEFYLPLWQVALV
jgi:hypothetical protein